MNYNIISLTTINADGSLSRFENGAAGKLLVGVSDSQLPVWKTLTEAGVAASNHNHTGTYVPLSGDSTITGTVTATGFVGPLTGTATSVSNALSIQLGSGTAQTYDGSAALSVQVTPAAIGAKPDFSWPNAGLMTSGGTNQTPGSIAWPSGENSDGAYLLVHYKSGSFVNSWDKFAGLSSGPGILHWTGTATGATLNLLQGSTTGDVLTKTADGYAFQSIGAAIVPPVNRLQSDYSGTDSGDNRNQKVLFRGTNYNDYPHWEHIGDEDIYGATSGVPSVLISRGTGSIDGDNNCPGEWLPTDALSTTPQILAALSGSNNGLRFYSAAELGIVTSIPAITGLASGSTYPGYVLSVGASPNYAPSWVDAAPKATVLATPRTLTIGGVGKTFDGSANVSWTRGEIGYANYATQTFSGDFTENTWYRIAFSTDVQYSYATFIIRGVSGNSRTLCIFDVCLTTYSNPAIRQISYSVGSNIAFNKIRIVYKSGISGGAYLEILSNLNRTGNLYCEMCPHNGFSFLTTLTTGSNESASGYSVYEYIFNNNVGSNGQVLTSVNTTSGSTQTVSHAWTSLATPPSAPTNTPLADSETGAIGAAGSYATETHQHPYPSTISGTLEIAKGGTGATTADAAIAALGGIKKSGDTGVGALTFANTIATPFIAAGMNAGIGTIDAQGRFGTTNNVDSYVTGNRKNINLYDADISSSINSPTDLSNTINAGNDTVINIVCGQSATANYTRYFKIPTPTVNRLGDTLTVYFTNQNPTKIGTLWAMCETDNRITDLNYANFSNAGSSGFKVCKWSSGNVLQFTCIRKGASGDYFWRAVKYSESSDWPES